MCWQQLNWFQLSRHFHSKDVVKIKNDAAKIKYHLRFGKKRFGLTLKYMHRENGFEWMFFSQINGKAVKMSYDKCGNPYVIINWTLNTVSIERNITNNRSERQATTITTILFKMIFVNASNRAHYSWRTKPFHFSISFKRRKKINVLDMRKSQRMETVFIVEKTSC